MRCSNPCFGLKSLIQWFMLCVTWLIHSGLRARRQHEQPQGVQHHQQRGHLMRDCRAHRTDDTRVGEADRYKIHDTGEDDDVLPHDGDGLPAYFKQLWKTFEGMSEINDVGGFRR